MLVEEANATRALRGLRAKDWVYKGYGIFQYDLQFVTQDESYFRFRQWHDFQACVNRAIKELTSIYGRNGGKLWEAVRAYNGAGQAARNYRDNVKEFTAAAQAEIDSMKTKRFGAKLRERGPLRVGEVLLTTSFAFMEAEARKPIVPSSRPQMTQNELAARLQSHSLDRAKHPLIVVGIRGYFRDTMGAAGC